MFTDWQVKRPVTHLCSDGGERSCAVSLAELSMLLHQRFQQHLVMGHLMLGVPSRDGRRSGTLLHLLELPTIAEELICVWNTLSTLQAWQFGKDRDERDSI